VKHRNACGSQNIDVTKYTIKSIDKFHDTITLVKKFILDKKISQNFLIKSNNK